MKRFLSVLIRVRGFVAIGDVDSPQLYIYLPALLMFRRRHPEYCTNFRPPMNHESGTLTRCCFHSGYAYVFSVLYDKDRLRCNKEFN